MLNTLGYDSLDAFIDKVVPPSIRIKEDTISDASMPPLSESEMMNRAQQVANQNEMYKNFIGMGYVIDFVDVLTYLKTGGKVLERCCSECCIEKRRWIFVRFYLILFLSCSVINAWSAHS